MQSGIGVDLTLLKKQLKKKGWVKLKCDNVINSVTYVHELSIALGTPVSGRNKFIAEILQPQSKSQAHPSSLSAKYGYDYLPLHSDTAHWLVPCRYIILTCINPGESIVPTILLDTLQASLSPEEKKLTKSATFFVKNGRKSFYSRVYTEDNKFIRFDPGCMEPICNDGQNIMEAFSFSRQKLNTITFEWSHGDILIIDNWRMLHGRGNSLNIDSSRCLLRMLIHVQ